MNSLRLPRFLAATIVAGLASITILRAADPGVVRIYSEPSPLFTTLAGSGSAGSANGSGLAAGFKGPMGIATSSGTIFVADSGNHTIRRITESGEVTTLAGSAGQAGHTDGTGSASRFNLPIGITADSSGNLYVADQNNHVIRQISPTGAVATIAGSAGNPGSTDGMVAAARFNSPIGIARDTNGNLYVADYSNSRIRKITPAGIVTTIVDLEVIHANLNGAGSSAGVGRPFGIVADSTGNVYFTDNDNHVIRKVTPAGVVSPFAGLAGVFGSSDGPGTAARFHQPAGLSIDPSGNLIVVDHVNRLVRRVTPAGVVTTVAGVALEGGRTDGAGAAARFVGPHGIAVDAGGNIMVADGTAHQIRLSVSAPVFTTQPTAELNIRVGDTRSIEAFVSDFPVALQWRKNGVAVPGATSPVLRLSNAQVSDSGAYELAATNVAGTTVSRRAQVSVMEPITITRQPGPVLALVGDAVQFRVTATPANGAIYFWAKNGAAIPGATTATLTLNAITAADAGDYFVRVSNPVSVVDSVIATLVVRPLPTPPPTPNPNPTPTPPAAPTIATQPTAQTAIVGSGVQFSASATGTGPFTFQWRKDGVAIPGATGATLALAAVQARDAGAYSVTITNSTGSITSAAAALTVAPGSRLANLSIRTSTGAGQTVIVGLATSGARDVLVRAVGPALAQFGLTGAMTDPRLELFSGQTLVLGNDNWARELEPLFASVGAFALPSRSLDAAIRQKIGGAVSLQAHGTGPGVVLLEAYDLGDDPASRLVNVSARNRVGSGDDIMIAGFNLTGTGNKRLLVRAVGPGLAAFSVTGTLTDPVLELFAGANRIAGNDNWSAELAPEFTSVGAFALPLGSRDAALVVTLPPGTYTAQVRSTDGSLGEALVELYELP